MCESEGCVWKWMVLCGNECASVCCMLGCPATHRPHPPCIPSVQGVVMILFFVFLLLCLLVYALYIFLLPMIVPSLVSFFAYYSS